MSRKRAATMIAAALALLAGRPGASGPAGKARPAGRGPTAAEFAALKQRVDEQNELIMKLTQLEGEHYEFLLKLAAERPPRSAADRAPSPPPRRATAADRRRRERGPPPPAAPMPTARPPSSRTITGRVDVSRASRGARSTSTSTTSKSRPSIATRGDPQKDRAFVPNALVVQRGTHVVVSQRRSVPAQRLLAVADAAVRSRQLQAGREARHGPAVRRRASSRCSATCTRRCARTSWSSPTATHVKVGGDGSFRLENVPVGARQVVAWTPDAKPMTQSVALTPAGASVGFALQVEPAAATSRQDGQAEGTIPHQTNRRYGDPAVNRSVGCARRAWCWWSPGWRRWAAPALLARRRAAADEGTRRQTAERRRARWKRASPR